MPALTIQFSEPKTLKTYPARQIIADKMVITMLIDDPIKKMVIATTQGYPDRIVLWQDDDYDAIGQWTDADVINRIKEIYGDV